jgi:hypothetical protein
MFFKSKTGNYKEIFGSLRFVSRNAQREMETSMSGLNPILSAGISQFQKGLG